MSLESADNLVEVQPCLACGRLGRKRFCSPRCRLMFAEFTCLNELQTIFFASPWSGGRLQAQVNRRYYRGRMRAAVRKLGSSAEELGSVLVEILEDLG